MENNTKDNAASPSVESLVKRGYLFLEDSEWNKADEYFDKALDINPEHAPAYIGKLCAELRVRREESLGDYQELRKGKIINKPLGEYANFQKALRFADEGYLKKLNGYEQKLKESFPKIPQRFTDGFIKSEIVRLEKEIANCEKEIAEEEKEFNYVSSSLTSLRNKRQNIIDDYNRRYSFNDGYDTKARWAIMVEDYMYQANEKELSDMSKASGDARRRIVEKKDKKAGCESKKREQEQLAGISCLDRMDVYYNRLAEAMQKGSTEDDFKKFAEQFCSLEGYKDSADLADKCGKMAIKLQYEKLVQEKNNATTEEAYRELSKQFRKMGNYENSAQIADECNKLADECVKQKEREKKARYDALVQAKNSASTEDKYKQLTQDFREMGNYENAVQLANECDKQMNVLKKRREEQESQEQARKAAKEAEDQAENERRRRYEEEQKHKKQRARNIRGLMFTFVPFILGMVFIFIGGDSTMIGLTIVLYGVPVFLMHFRIFFVFTIILFAFGIIFGLSQMSFMENNDLCGLVALVVAFIIAFVYPKEKYWDK